MTSEATHMLNATPLELSAPVFARKFTAAALDQANGNGRTAQEFREVLLGATLKYAWERSPFYHERLPSKVASGGFALEQLCELPILTKADVSKHRLDLRTSDEPGIIQNTTGTTGVPVEVYRTQTEVNFLRAFHQSVCDLLSSAAPNPKPLAVEIASAYHGDVLPLPRLEHVLTTGFFDDVLVTQAARWLLSAHSIPRVQSRVSILIGIYHLVEWFTLLLHDRKFPFERCKIERVYTGGGFITERWKRVLAHSWRAPITAVYSLTEIFTRAASCDLCGGYHFLPNVVPELVDPIEGIDLSPQIGELLLTGLFPFNQGQPAIRYQTGDLFRRESGGCECGDSYFFLGRTKYSACFRTADNQLVVLGSAQLLSILDEFAEVSRSCFLEPLFGAPVGDEIGRPIFSVEIDKDQSTDHHTVTLSVKLTVDPFLFGNSCTEFSNICEERIRKQFPCLVAALKSGCLTLNIRCISSRSGAGLTALDERIMDWQNVA